MCTTIVNQAIIDGSGKGAKGWFKVSGVNVSYDHPYHSRLEHALNIDFVNETEGPSARVGVEISLESARHLVECIQSVLNEADAGGYQDEIAGGGGQRVAPGPQSS